MLNKTRSRILFFLLTGSFAIVFSCRNSNTSSEAESDIITPVTIAPVIFKSVTSTVDLHAVSMFMNRSTIRATTTGTIENISVFPGDFITSGQLLFTIRTREAMALKRASVNDTSLSIKGLININSQKEGIISSVAYQKGDFVLEGDDLAVLAERNSLVFILEVPVELNDYVEKNRKCLITLPDKKQISGIISGSLPEMDTQTQTVKYIIKPAATAGLPANLIATVSLIKSSSENAAVLPKSAVLSNETQTEFWIMKLINDSTAVKIVVKKGFENNEEVEITDPLLHESDRIILTGNYGLPDTARISVIKE
jgi:multidrug efflux pump subunit AcrA (membrane-fusion protein)